MADTVQEILEGMVPELEDLARKKLFSRSEIKEIVRKRRDFEYKLKRRESQKQEYLRYIAYESALDRLRAKRKTRLGFGKKSKSSVSDFSMQKRLHFIFDRMLRKWKGDAALWHQYIDFCVQQRATKMLGGAFARALQYHPRDCSLWMRSATWHFDESGDIKAARVLCQRALRMNAGSSELWWHYLRLELCYIDKLRQRQKLLGIDEVSETTGEPSKLSAATVRIASTIVTNARAATTPSAHLLLGLAEVCLDFPGTEEVENTLLREVTEEFPSEPSAWLARAQRVLRRVTAQLHAGRTPSVSLQEAELAAFAAFDDLLIDHKQAVALWSAFLQMARESTFSSGGDNSDGQVSSGEKPAARLMSAYGQATNTLGKRCPEEIWLAYCHDLNALGHGEEAIKVARDGCARLAEARVAAGQLTIVLLQQALGTSENVDSVLEECLKWALTTPSPDCDTEHGAEPADIVSLKLWKCYLEHIVADQANDASYISSRWAEAIASCKPSAASELQSDHLKWICDTYGIVSARVHYRRLLRDGALCNGSSASDYVRSCISLELAQPAESLDRAAIRYLFELASSRDDGRDDPSMWLEWVTLEENWGQWTHASALYSRAMHVLKAPNAFAQLHSLGSRAGAPRCAGGENSRVERSKKRKRPSTNGI